MTAADESLVRAGVPCNNCQQSLAVPAWAGYHSNCRGCQVRALANGICFWQSRSVGVITRAYRTALEQIFGAQWKAGHAEVLAEHQRLQAMRDP